MVVNVAVLEKEEDAVLKDIRLVSEHLVQIQRLVGEIKEGRPEVLGEPVKIGDTQTKTPGRIGELLAYLTEFHHYAKRVYDGGLLFVKYAEQK
jgi:hypothetical protein